MQFANSNSKWRSNCSDCLTPGPSPDDETAVARRGELMLPLSRSALFRCGGGGWGVRLSSYVEENNMALSAILPLTSTIVSLGFAVALLWRYVERKRAHYLVWGLGVLIYGTGTFAEFYSSQAWDATIFRLWYLCGAVLAAAWVGQGTGYLLGGQS